MENTPVASTPARLDSRFRWLSAVEFLLGSFIVIGHNVFKILPNEVPILFVLGMISLRLRDGGWGAMGFPHRPEEVRSNAMPRPGKGNPERILPSSRDSRMYQRGAKSISRQSQNRRGWREQGSAYQNMWFETAISTIVCQPTL